MGDVSNIEWLFNPYTMRQGSSWNRWFGCDRISEACLNCYIFRQPPLRMRGLKFSKAAIGGSTEIVMAPPQVLFKPLKWTAPRMIFVESLGDLWHGAVALRETARTYAVMLLAQHHVIITSTKRTRRMRNWLREPRFADLVRQALDEIVADCPIKLTREQISFAYSRVQPGQALRLTGNIWTGTTVENNDTAAERIPLILDIDVPEDGVRWLSCEPLTHELTDPLRLSPHLNRLSTTSRFMDWVVLGGESGTSRFIDWVVLGGESGPAAKATELDTQPAVGLRPIDLPNLHSLVGQVQRAGARVFVKQLGEPWAKQVGAASKEGRDMNEWPAGLRVRDYPLQLAEHTLRVDPDNQLAKETLWV